jgi:CRP-like cAMP-binding protein
MSWLTVHPTAAFGLLETLSLRLRQKDESLSDLAMVDLSHRLAKRLADLAALDAAGKARSAGIGVAVTQSEIAGLLGASRQSVNKELKKFEGRGWITVSRGEVCVTDGPALRRYWQGDI